MVRQFPAVSLHSGGGIIWEKERMIQDISVAAMTSGSEIKDGERLNLAEKNLEKCKLYPEIIRHNLDGRCVPVSGDGKYIICTAHAGKQKLRGYALQFVWSATGDYALLVSEPAIEVYSKLNKLKKSSPPVLHGECIFGGKLLSVCSESLIRFYDWSECALVHQIHLNVRNVMWANLVDLVAIASAASFVILKYNKSAKQAGEAPMVPVYTSNERVRTGLWANKCFIYINSAWCLKCCVGDEVMMSYNLNCPTHYLDRPMDLMGYSGNQIYLIDVDYNVVRYTVSHSLNEYIACMLRGDLDAANNTLPSIPKDKYSSILSFLDSKGILSNILLEELKVNEKVITFKVGRSEVPLRAAQLPRCSVFSQRSVLLTDPWTPWGTLRAMVCHIGD